MNDQKTIEKRILDLETRISVLESLLKSSTVLTTVVKKLSAKEYLLEKHPKSAVEKTFFLGAFLEKHQEKSSFTLEDLRQAFRAAREPLPANMNDMINKNIQKGLFMEAERSGSNRSWMITAKGEKVLEALNE